LVDESAIVVDNEQVGRMRISRRRRRASGNPGQFVKAAIDRNIPRYQAVWAAGGPANQRFLEPGQRKRIFFGDELSGTITLSECAAGDRMLHRGSRVDAISAPDPAAANGGEQFEKGVRLLERPLQSFSIIHELT